MKSFTRCDTWRSKGPVSLGVNLMKQPTIPVFQHSIIPRGNGSVSDMKTKLLIMLAVLFVGTGGATRLAHAEYIFSPPQIANGRVVWAAYEVTESVEPGEIYLYDIADRSIQRLTHSEADDGSPRINDEVVAWVERDEAGNETWMIYQLATGQTREEGGSFVWEKSSQVDGDLTVLTRHEGADRDIVIYSASLKTENKITENSTSDHGPGISGENVSWVRGEGSESEIFMMSGSEGGVEIQVTENDYEDGFAHIAGDALVWQGRVDSDWEIFLYNVQTVEDPIQISDNSYDDILPQTDGNYVTWLGYGRSGGEILVYDISSGETTTLSLEEADQDCDGEVGLADAIAALQIVSGLSPVDICVSPGLNEDERIGLEEVLYILQRAADMR